MEYMTDLTQAINFISKVVEFVGVMIMFFGLLFAFVRAAMSRKKFTHKNYLSIRQAVGKAILLGLEVLIAADIMATVVTKPTMDEVIILAVIVLIRTFLSLSLQVELEGRFPWQKETATADTKPIVDRPISSEAP